MFFLSIFIGCSFVRSWFQDRNPLPQQEIDYPCWDSGWYDTACTDTGWADTATDFDTGPVQAWDSDYDGDGFTENQGDCNDFDSTIHPDAEESPADGRDQNCDAMELCYADNDEDGYGLLIMLSSVLDCSDRGTSPQDGDCNDSDAMIHPQATELCDFVDNDCDGLIDDEDPSIDVDTQQLFYQDSDLDGNGNPSSMVQTCQQPSGYVDNNTDCDDTNPAINTQDADADGFSSCAGDCDDTDPTVTRCE